MLIVGCVAFAGQFNRCAKFLVKVSPFKKITVFAVHLQHNTHAFSQSAVHDFAVNAGRWRNWCCTLCGSQILAVRCESILQFRGWDFRCEITQLVERTAGVVATASVQESQMVFLQGEFVDVVQTVGVGCARCVEFGIVNIFTFLFFYLFWCLRIICRNKGIDLAADIFSDAGV